MSYDKHIVCPHCNAINRIPEDRLGDAPVCGKCKKHLFGNHPTELNAGNFAQHLNRNDIPVVVDFWAPWCGPCKMMAPAFEQAATQLEPKVRFAKVNTEREQTLGQRFQIRSIPTMVVFRNGKEVARQSGAMGATDIVRWVRQFA